MFVLCTFIFGIPTISYFVDQYLTVITLYLSPLFRYPWIYKDGWYTPIFPFLVPPLSPMSPLSLNLSLHDIYKSLPSFIRPDPHVPSFPFWYPSNPTPNSQDIFVSYSLILPPFPLCYFRKLDYLLLTYPLWVPLYLLCILSLCHQSALFLRYITLSVFSFLCSSCFLLFFFCFHLILFLTLELLLCPPKLHLPRLHMCYFCKDGCSLFYWFPAHYYALPLSATLVAALLATSIPLSFPVLCIPPCNYHLTWYLTLYWLNFLNVILSCFYIRLVFTDFFQGILEIFFLVFLYTEVLHSVYISKLVGPYLSSCISCSILDVSITWYFLPKLCQFTTPRNCQS